MNLDLFIIIPLLTSIAILVMRPAALIRAAALTGAAIQLIMAVGLLVAFNSARTAGLDETFLFGTTHSWFPSMNIQYATGVDGMSVAMILLTAFVVIAGVLVSWNEQQKVKEFFFMLTFLSLGAYGFFIATDLFLLFFFLEVAVIPKYLLIGIWGSGKKEYSAMKLALMLMGGSALIFVGLAGVYLNTFNEAGVHTFSLTEMMRLHVPLETQLYFFPFAFIGFGIFTAMFPFHTWVPDGHSSAPTAASMFLAGISMKLGGYGCLRVAVNLMPEATAYYSDWIIVLATIAIIYGAFATLMQKDLKYINAYSSVSHCGFVILGIGMLTETSVNGAIMQMVSHGLMTALFFAAIGMIYSRTHTREVKKIGGLLKVTPFISTVFVIAGLCSLGLPGFSGFVAEMTVFVGSWEHPEMFYRVATILACASIVVTAVYILRAVGKVIMGPLETNSDSPLTDASWNEKLAGSLLVIAIVIMGIAPFYISNLTGPASVEILKRIVALN